MKKYVLLSALLTSGVFAGSFTVIDPFGLPKCPVGQTVGCDVVGPTTEFDFYRADFNFTATTATISLYFNFGVGNQSTLDPFIVGSNTPIGVADLFIYAGGNIYAIPLHNRTNATYGNATAGTVYQANSPSALLNSEIALENPTGTPAPPGIIFRPGYPVWINTNQASIASVGSLGITLDPTIDGYTTRFLVQISFDYSSNPTLAAALANGSFNNIGIFTGTATCANDLVENPEPSTWVMLSSGAGLALLALRRRKRA